MFNEHMKETADMIAGYTVGRLIVDRAAGNVGLQNVSGMVSPLTSEHSIEVRNGEQYERLTIDQVLAAVTAEGWPGYAGLNARVK